MIGPMWQWRTALCVAWLLAWMGTGRAEASGQTTPASSRATKADGMSLPAPFGRYTGDLDAMVERRMIRVLTAYSKTQYFIDNGTPRGTAYDQGKLLEDELNKKLPVR